MPTASVFSAVQLHGDEPPEDLLALDRFRIIRAFRLGGPDDVRAMNDYLDRTEVLGRPPDAVLVDALVAGIPGGTGTLVAEDVLSLIPPLPRLILAGGLDPENVADRIARVRPWMVDVASGVEVSPAGRILRRSPHSSTRPDRSEASESYVRGTGRISTVAAGTCSALGSTQQTVDNPVTRG